jgi:Flp pilus assembly CpaF family ATPase
VSVEETASRSGEETWERLRDVVEERARAEMAALGRPLSEPDRQLLYQSLTAEVLQAEALDRLAEGRGILPPDVEARLTTELVADVTDPAGIEEHRRNPDVTDLHFNGYDNCWVTFRDLSSARARSKLRSNEELRSLIHRLARQAGVAVDPAAVELDFSLPDGTRVTAGLSRAAPFPVLSLRFLRTIDIDVPDLVALSMMSPELGEFTAGLAHTRLNLLVDGGPGVGKTTYLSAWAHEIPVTERIATVEDTYELLLHLDGRHHNVVPLVARQPNSEGAGAVSMSALMRLAKRLNPSRVICGETRGGEAMDMLDAMSQGCAGSGATIHASSPKEAFSRLANYCTRALEHPLRADVMYDIAHAIDVVVHLARSRDDGRRVVASVREVTGSVEGDIPASRELWAPGPDGVARRTSVPPSAALMDELAAAGVDPALFRPGEH